MSIYTRRSYNCFQGKHGRCGGRMQLRVRGRPNDDNSMGCGCECHDGCGCGGE